MSSRSILRFLLAGVVAAASVDAQPSAPRASITQTLRLDATAEEFSFIGRMAVGPRGEMAIPQVMDATLRIYDSTGKRVATVGRRGSGPGEFRALTGIRWLADTIWAYDSELKRSTFMRPNGAIIRTAMITGELSQTRSEGAVGELLHFSPTAALRDGSMVGIASYVATSRPGERPIEEQRVVRVSSNGAHRVLARLELRPSDRSMEVSGWRNDVPFAALPRLAFASDGSKFLYVTTRFATREGGTFTVSLFSANGDTIFVRTFPFRGVPIPRRVADSAIAALNPGRAKDPELPPEIGKRFQEEARKRMPSVYAPVERVIIGLDDTVWLVLHGTAAGQIALVLNGRGDPINTVPMPPKSHLMQANAANIWMMEESETDLTSIVRYRLSGMSCTTPCR